LKEELQLQSYILKRIAAVSYESLAVTPLVTRIS
jgi:hypothetical protein